MINWYLLHIAGRSTNLRGAASLHIDLYVCFFNSKITEYISKYISKWYQTFLFPLTHSTSPMPLLSYFWDTLYKQNMALPWALRYLPLLLILVIRNLESKAMSLIRSPLLFYYRYVDDDIIMEIPLWLIRFSTFLTLSIRGFQFTMEIDNDFRIKLFGCYFNY